jgi:VanZ family protein
MTGRRRDRVVLSLVVVGHLLVLYWPRTAGPEGVPHLDKVVHALIFGGVLWAGRRAGLPDRLLVPVLVAHAFVSEALQAWLLPGRSGDLSDVVADVVGVAAVAVAGGRRWGRGSKPDRASWRDERAAAGGAGGER